MFPNNRTTQSISGLLHGTKYPQNLNFGEKTVKVLRMNNNQTVSTQKEHHLSSSTSLLLQASSPTSASLNHDINMIAKSQQSHHGHHYSHPHNNNYAEYQPASQYHQYQQYRHSYQPQQQQPQQPPHQYLNNNNDKTMFTTTTTTSSSSSSLYNNKQFINDNMLFINVGGQIFTTTKNTMKKSSLFLKFFNFGKKRPTINGKSEEKEKENKKDKDREKEREKREKNDNSKDKESKHQYCKSQSRQSESAEIQYLEDIPQHELIKRQTTFENYCVEHLEKTDKTLDSDNDDDDNDKIPDGIYQIDTNYYFVDRSPQKFEDILHFLRNYPTINAMQFISRYYSLSGGIRRNSLSALSSNNSMTNLIDVNNNNHNGNNITRELLKLQDEAKFYQITPLDKAIQGIHCTITSHPKCFLDEFCDIYTFAKLRLIMPDCVCL